MTAPKAYTTFFYGTLLHPSILRRVIGHHGADLDICPALLLVSPSQIQPLPHSPRRDLFYPTVPC